MSRSVEKLSNTVINALRASAVFPSFNRVVEELVLNSLDAGSINIKIMIDLDTFSIEVQDDGVGICHTDLRDKTGEWNSTSKYEENLLHGFRGEALAAIRALSIMTVISKTRDCKLTYAKSFRYDHETGQDYSCLKSSSSSLTTSGTKISVSELFERIPFRRKSVRTNIEVLRVKEFIQRISVLYHEVGWLLIEGATEKVIIKLAPQESVSARFAAFHGQTSQYKMKDASVSHGPFMLSGLLSPPLTDCCHWTKDCQYFYVNNRWLRNTDIVSSMIDKAYVAILTSQRSGGPQAKHHAPKGPQIKPHPCFILQLICSHECYDVLCEPDKTKAVFTDPYGLKLCVKKLLTDMLQNFCPDLIDAACSSFADDNDTTMATDCPKKALKNYIPSAGDDDLDDKEDAICLLEGKTVDCSYLYGVRTKEDVDFNYEIGHPLLQDSGILQKELEIGSSPSISQSPQISAFKAAFLETPPVELGEMMSRSNKIEEFQSQPISLFAEFEFGQIQPRPAAETNTVLSGDKNMSVNNGDQEHYEEEDCSSQSTDEVNAEDFESEICLGIQSNKEIADVALRIRGVTVNRISFIMDEKINGFRSGLSPSAMVNNDSYPYNSLPVMATCEFSGHVDDDQSCLSNFSNEESCRRNDFMQESNIQQPSNDIDKTSEYSNGCNSDDGLNPVNTTITFPSVLHSHGDKRTFNQSEQEYNRLTNDCTDYNPLHKRRKGSTGPDASLINYAAPVGLPYTYYEEESRNSAIHDITTVESDFSNFESAALDCHPLVTPCQSDLTEAVFNSLFFTTPSTSPAVSKSLNSNSIEPGKNLYNKYEVKWIDPTDIKEIPTFVIPASSKIGNKISLRRADYPVLPKSSVLDCDFDIPNIDNSRTNKLSTNGCDVKPISTKITNLTLKKDMLVKSRTIGQVDSKYILVADGNLLMIIDQHAADERVKLEEMLYGDGDCENDCEDTDMISNTRSITGSKIFNETLVLTENDIFILINRSEIFHHWKFLYKFVCNNHSDFDDTAKELNHEGNPLSSAYKGHISGVKLIQVPIIYGEALNEQDFIEFIESVSTHSHWMAPSSMLKPPSVRRIAASKACRTAVKFGDVLNILECTNMVDQLSKTKLPFQCAHGRPSVVPVLKQDEARIMSQSQVNLPCDSLLRLDESLYMKRPNYSNLIKHKK